MVRWPFWHVAKRTLRQGVADVEGSSDDDNGEFGSLRSQIDNPLA